MSESEFNLVYKWTKPEGYHGCKCKIGAHGQQDRVWLLFEDGRKLMRSKWAVCSAEKFFTKQPQPRLTKGTMECPHCNGTGKVKIQTEVEF